MSEPNEPASLWERRARCAIWDASAAPEGWAVVGLDLRRWRNVEMNTEVVSVITDDRGLAWYRFEPKMNPTPFDYAYDAMRGSDRE